jgi:hypothetical protein
MGKRGPGLRLSAASAHNERDGQHEPSISLPKVSHVLSTF